MNKIFAITVLFFMTACGASYTLTKPEAVNEIPAVNSAKAQIVFMRPRSGGFGMDLYSAQVFDITESKENIIASLAPATKAVVDYEPGEYTLFSTEAATRGHIMKMKVEAGKRYYVLVRPIYGHGYQLRPIKHKTNYDYSYSNALFASWLSATVLHAKAEGVEQWHADFQKNITKIKAEAWQQWQAKTEEQQLELTLLPEDASKE